MLSISSERAMVVTSASAQAHMVGRLERLTEADGQLTYREAARVEHAHDHVSRSIARQRHEYQRPGR